MGKGRKKGTEFECKRDTDGASNFPDQIHICLFQFCTTQIRIGGQIVDVEFQRISSCLLYGPGIIGPATRRDELAPLWSSGEGWNILEVIKGGKGPWRKTKEHSPGNLKSKRCAWLRRAAS